jgi:hypothetical protein
MAFSGKKPGQRATQAASERVMLIHFVQHAASKGAAMNNKQA